MLEIKYIHACGRDGGEWTSVYMRGTLWTHLSSHVLWYVVVEPGTDERAVRLNRNSVLGTVIRNGALLAEGVQLKIIGQRYN